MAGHNSAYRVLRARSLEMSTTGINWHEIDWQLIDSEIARRMGCGVSTVWYARKRLGETPSAELPGHGDRRGRSKRSRLPYTPAVSNLIRDAQLIAQDRQDSYLRVTHIEQALKRK